MEKDVKALTEIEEKLHALSEKDRKRIVEWLHEKYCPAEPVLSYNDPWKIIGTPSIDGTTTITCES